MLRIRFTFQDTRSVMTSIRSPSGTPQMAVGLGLPSLVNVVSSRYFDWATSWKVGAWVRRPQFQADVARAAAAQLGEEIEHFASSPYRLPIASYTRSICRESSRMLATASTASPLTLPLRSQTARVTRGVFRIRLTFQESLPVITRARSPSGAIQIGVGLGLPSFVKVSARRTGT
ncbi:hypothetical protein Y900_000015 [Mycolicibacterium aromaticivorans JS19b1 = JCM 16368]|uniref:Uncharacterized protein n=1 Tax=Mycolicibacterium aromaticivorans JS19b1 = JCM 16368 TaxID=1440774 RepID=A0A064CF50_9MYCO|nr:hypothetical protein Y900_000015 [Mycolicibacterium aromaticivorans JS19b1 = JCM 16368]